MVNIRNFRNSSNYFILWVVVYFMDFPERKILDLEHLLQQIIKFKIGDHKHIIRNNDENFDGNDICTV